MMSDIRVDKTSFRITDDRYVVTDSYHQHAGRVYSLQIRAGPNITGQNLSLGAQAPKESDARTILRITS